MNLNNKLIIASIISFIIIFGPILIVIMIPSPHDSSSTPDSSSEYTPKITEEEAKKIAEEEVSGTVVSIELEKDGEIYVYVVVIENEEGLWDVKINADTGEVVEVEPN